MGALQAIDAAQALAVASGSLRSVLTVVEMLLQYARLHSSLSDAVHASSDGFVKQLSNQFEMVCQVGDNDSPLAGFGCTALVR